VFSQAGAVVFSSLIADIVPEKVRGRYFGIRHAFAGAVVCPALLIGGFILERFPGLTGFSIIYLIAAAAVFWNIAEMFKYPNPPSHSQERHLSLQGLFKPFRDQAVLKPFLFVTLFMLMYNMATPLFSYVMLDIHHLKYSWLTLITVVFHLVVMVNFISGEI
jgi:MFS family permease